MEILFLGTGTSHGVPMIGCDCATCRSENPKDRRLRTSVQVTFADRHVLIDTATDLRQQFLKFGIRQIDAILFTHAHADHIFGLDDTRPVNRIRRDKIPCYGSPQTIEEIRRIYSYVFDYPDIPGGIPMIRFHPVTGPFELFGVKVQPIEILHGTATIYAYRIGDLVYATDCSAIPESSFALMAGAEILVLDCLRLRPHPTHFNLEQAVTAAQRIGARTTYFTHLSHEMGHDAVSRQLPERMFLAYDGLTLTLPKVL